MRPGEDSPYMLLVAPVQEDRGRLPNGQCESSQGIDKLKRVALDDPGGHARRLLGPRADRRPRAARPVSTSC